MSKYLLNEDKLIGHELVINKISLYRKKLFLKDVYYNDLITYLEKVNGIKSEDSCTNLLYTLDFLVNKILINNFSLRNGGGIIGREFFEKRIKTLQTNFVLQYTKKTKEILEKKEKIKL